MNARLPRGIPTVALVAWLGWRGVFGVGDIARELDHDRGKWADALRLSAEQRIGTTLRRWDVETGMRPGYSTTLVEALNANVPPDGIIQLVDVPDRTLIRALVPLPHLVFPRRFRAVDPRPAQDWEPDPAGIYLVFGHRREANLKGRKKVLASSDDWTLWR